MQGFFVNRSRVCGFNLYHQQPRTIWVCNTDQCFEGQKCLCPSEPRKVSAGGQKSRSTNNKKQDVAEVEEVEAAKKSPKKNKQKKSDEVKKGKKKKDKQT